MGDNVPHSGDFFPGNTGVLISEVFGESFGSFADDDNAANDSILFFDVYGESFGCDAFGILSDEFDGFNDVNEGFLVTRYK